MGLTAFGIAPESGNTKIYSIFKNKVSGHPENKIINDFGNDMHKKKKYPANESRFLILYTEYNAHSPL